MKDKLAPFLQGAVWLSSICSAFLIPPPNEIFGPAEQGKVTLTQFIMMILVGLMSVAGRRLQSVRYWYAWWSLSLVSLTLLVVGLVNYSLIRQEVIVHDMKVDKVIGSKLQAHVYEHKDDKLNAGDLLEAYKHEPADIWTKESILDNSRKLAYAYILLLPALVVSCMSLLNVLGPEMSRKESPARQGQHRQEPRAPDERIQDQAHESGRPDQPDRTDSVTSEFEEPPA